MAYIGETAYMFDVDDVLVDRGGATRLAGYLAGIQSRNRIPSEKLHVSPLDRTISNRSVHGLELASLNSHARRLMNHGVPQLIGSIHHQKDAAIINTGRANVSAWVDMTKRRFNHYGIGHLFQAMYFTPDGVSTAESKAEAINQESSRYERVIVVDDDGRTIFRLAQAVPPNVELNLLHQPLTHLLVPEEVFTAFSNVRHIDHLSEIYR